MMYLLRNQHLYYLLPVDFERIFLTFSHQHRSTTMGVLPWIAVRLELLTMTSGAPGLLAVAVLI